MYEKLIQSPIGLLTLRGDGSSLTALFFGGMTEAAYSSCPVLEQAAGELAEYFAGARRNFTVPLSPAGTAFQQKVWQALREIPYGETASYGEIASRVGSPKACRAVGLANRRNPLPIFVPCHRVVGSDGSLTGYAGGLKVKQFLLDLEGAV